MARDLTTPHVRVSATVGECGSARGPSRRSDSPPGDSEPGALAPAPASWACRAPVLPFGHRGSTPPTGMDRGSPMQIRHPTLLLCVALAVPALASQEQPRPGQINPADVVQHVAGMPERGRTMDAVRSRL